MKPKSKRRVRYTVYSETVAKELIKISRQTHTSVLQALKKYPNCNWAAMVSMACHRAATIATNAAVGKPLGRRWSFNPKAPGE